LQQRDSSLQVQDY